MDSAAFVTKGNGQDPEELFWSLRDTVSSGTIAEKQGFVLRSRTPLPESDVMSFIERDVKKNSVEDPAFAVPYASMRPSGKSKTLRLSVRANTRDEAEREARKKAVQILGAEWSDGYAGMRLSILDVGRTSKPSSGFERRSITKASAKFAVFNSSQLLAIVDSKNEAREVCHASEDSTTGVYKLIPLEEWVSGEGVKKARYRVVVKATKLKSGPTEGYIFYGVSPKINA